MTNTAKLRGRLAEKGYTLSSFSDAIGLSRPSFRSKLNNTTEFKVSEIDKMRKLLDISASELESYFFYA